MSRINEFCHLMTDLRHDRCFPYRGLISSIHREQRVGVGNSPSADKMRIYRSTCSSGRNWPDFSVTPSALLAKHPSLLTFKDTLVSEI